MPAMTITLHILSVVIWVGGMFFAHMVLRPVAAHLLEPTLRIPLMLQVLGRFFPWVWIAIVLLWATGLWLIFGFYGGMAKTPISVHIMLTLGFIMTVVFVYIFFAPFQGMKERLAAKNFQKAGQYLATIRQLIAINLLLGLLTIIVATAGRFF